MNYESLLAGRTELMKANAIREILKVVSKPGVISLAGGIPSPDSFPMDIFKELTDRVLTKYSSGAFQYDLTEGFVPLREQVSLLLKSRGIDAPPDTVNITSGSQGVLDAVAKLLISKGDKIALEAPTYLGALSAFNPYEPTYIRMDMDEEGLVPESLEQTLKTHKIKFIYLVPTFQNPTGRTITLERREKIARIIKKYNALLVEDDPYSALRYKGENIPAIKTLAKDNVIYISTLSKIFAPGLRIGFYAAPKFLRQWLVLVKQGVDLHTSTFNQALAAEYLEGNYLVSHLPKIINLYKPKQAAMLSAIEEKLPKEFTCSPSDGGMFLWVTGPRGFDMIRLYHKAIENGVAFVPGKFFFTSEEEGIETMRLNYTMADEKTIDLAIGKLADTILSL
ncbi:MAG: PLP-dependent aminotransferase family protein [Proteobacteria bacterium]|nr:PLP-dependent aminotransferase family protein [Pseudomonadota bacterium]MBU1584483.1 PLP-dependent aminotransferase family protein [Pseudomonadota bacterium]MBU2456054.1 PLP-dependent aminotransferase family protein [Pseudomonadota bacterium]MBU2628213.1 PLP-dependent aminotransferase family protein [Pseudomonadota bacterium]